MWWALPALTHSIKSWQRYATKAVNGSTTSLHKCLNPNTIGAGSKKSFSRFNDNGRPRYDNHPASGDVSTWASHVTEDCLWHHDAARVMWHQASGVGLCHIFLVFSQMSGVFMGYCGTHCRGRPHEPELRPHVNSVESRHHLAWALCLNKHHPSTKL